MRHVLVLGSALILCVVAATPLFAQQEDPPEESRHMFRDGYGASGHLKDIAWLVGEWEAGFQHDGSPLKFTTKTEWMHTSYLRSIWEVIDENGIHWTREITWFWDPEHEVIRNRNFDSDGEWGETEIETSERVLNARRTFIDQVGKPYTSTFVMKKTGPDSHTYAEVDGVALEYHRKK